MNWEITTVIAANLATVGAMLFFFGRWVGRIDVGMKRMEVAMNGQSERVRALELADARAEGRAQNPLKIGRK